MATELRVSLNGIPAEKYEVSEGTYPTVNAESSNCSKPLCKCIDTPVARRDAGDKSKFTIPTTKNVDDAHDNLFDIMNKHISFNEKGSLSLGMDMYCMIFGTKFKHILIKDLLNTRDLYMDKTVNTPVCVLKYKDRSFTSFNNMEIINYLSCNLLSPINNMIWNYISACSEHSILNSEKTEFESLILVFIEDTLSAIGLWNDDENYLSIAKTLLHECLESIGNAL